MLTYSFVKLGVVLIALAIVMPFLIGYCYRNRPRFSLAHGLIAIAISACALAYVKEELPNILLLDVAASFRRGYLVSHDGGGVQHPAVSSVFLAFAASAGFAWAVHAKHLEKIRANPIREAVDGEAQ